jgi:uncharacterized protein
MGLIVKHGFLFYRNTGIQVSPGLFTLNLLVFILISLYSSAQGNKNEPKPIVRTSEYRSGGSGAYIQELRTADLEFDNGLYPASAQEYVKYIDSLDKEQRNRLGWLYLEGLGVDRDLSKAEDQFKLAAKENLAQSYYYLGVIAHQQLGTRYVGREHLETVECFRKAADLGDPEAMNALGLEYEQDNFHGRVSNDERKENFRKVAEWYWKAAQGGSSNGMVNLSDCYSEGNGVKKNSDSAARWCRASAFMGNSVAMYNLGIAYESGKRPFRKNYDSAIYWYRLSAENGFADAMTNLGSQYYYGHGVPVDYNQAFDWYQRGAAAGDGMAARNIGRMYNFGIGVKKDVVTAMSWYDRADSLKRYILSKD